MTYSVGSTQPCSRYGARCGGQSHVNQHFLFQDENIRDVLISGNSDSAPESRSTKESEHIDDDLFDRGIEARAGTEAENNTNSDIKNATNNVSGDAPSALNEESAEIEYSSNGTTQCDRATGTMSTTVTNTKCTKKCTEAHEEDHRNYRKGCCKIYGDARNKSVEAGDWRTRNKLTKRYNNWVRDTSGFSECRAFGKIMECGKKLKKEFSCAARKKEKKECCKDARRYLKSMRKHRKKRCPGADQSCPAFT